MKIIKMIINKCIHCDNTYKEYPLKSKKVISFAHWYCAKDGHIMLKQIIWTEE